MEIRKMKEGDFPQVAELIRSLVPFWEISDEELLRRYRTIESDKNHTIIVADEDGTIAGTVTVILCHALGGDFITVEDVVVNEAYRRRGIGKALMERVDEYAEKFNCAYSILVSSGFRKEAHRFYEAQGYNDDAVGFRKMYGVAPHD